MPKGRRFSVRDVFSFFDSSGPEFHRLVYKNGETSIKLTNQPATKSCFHPNIFIAIVELTSTWIAMIFLTCFLLSWFVFTLLYYVVSKANGDFPDDYGDTLDNNVCVEGVHDFLSMFQFSMETQTTIGYGTRYVTENCPISILLVVCQSILGTLILSILTGVILFKFQEPSKRAHTVLFSKIVCVYEEDNRYYMEIQVLNMQRSQVIDPSVRGLVLMNSDPDNPKKVRHDLKFTAVDNSRLFFRPRVYRHLIDFSSPFWDYSKVEFETGCYEIVVVLNGVDEFTDSFVQVRTSYVPAEVEWGRHFKEMNAKRKGNKFKFNYTHFKKTKRKMDMSDDSASETFRRFSDVSVPSISNSIDSDSNVSGNLASPGFTCSGETIVEDEPDEEANAYINIGYEDGLCDNESKIRY